ncbi:MAG: hypothetical protein NWR46_11355, partial [Saprospiraceae bacterium]|nr:hypothetical protein [Saprospiraceae bacterium]
IKIAADDEIFFQDGKFTSINKLNKLNKKIKYSENQSFKWNKYLAKTGTENYGIYYKDKRNHYWVSNGSKFLYKFIITDFFERDLKQISTRGILKVGNDLYVNSYSGFFKNGVKIGPDFLIGGSNIFKKGNKLYFSGIRELYSYDMLSKKFALAFEDVVSNAVGEISCIFFYEEKWWIGGSNGLFYFADNKKLEATPINKMVNNFRIIEDKLYILGYEGVFTVKNGNYKNIENLPSNIECNDIAKVNDNFFLATSRGLLKYDAQNESFIPYFQNTVYENKEIFSLELDEFNFLWIGTKLGLVRFNVSTESFDIFMKDFEFNKRSSFKNEDKFYFGTTDGYVTFSPMTFFSSDLTGQNSLIVENHTNIYKFLLILAVSIILFLVIYMNRKLKNQDRIDIPIDKYTEPIIEEKPYEGIGKYNMSKIEHYIIENIDTINVDKLREDSGLTKNVFYKVFNQHYDIAPKRLIEILKEERINSRKKSQRRD